MRRNIIRKIIVALIIIAPAVSYTGCKKQAKCGCGKDVIKTLTNAAVNVIFNDTYSILYFQPVGDPYDSYYFCNPSEMIPKLADAKSGDVLLVSGHVYWDCNYVNQNSNSPGQSYMRIYQCQATELSLNLYGKK
jgi:hypothetical protein